MFHARLPRIAAAISLTALLAASTADAAHDYRLAPPFDVNAVRTSTGQPDKSGFTCKQPPAPLRDIHVESFYQKGDDTHSIVDPEAMAAYKKANEPGSTYEMGLASMANRYVRSSPPRAEIAACALDWFASWAEGGALLGEVNKNGEYTRKWLLGSISSDWMQVRDAPGLDPSKKQKVAAWIRSVAEQVKSDFSRDSGLTSRQNNHLYWAAWGVAAAGMAIDDRSLFDWGVSKARYGIGQIQADGTLPNELARGRRAYLYHLFAAMPLFMVANAAEKNGIDLFHENNSALKRLGEVSLKNLGDPTYFRDLTHKEQDMTHVGTKSDLGWVEIYRQHYNDPRADAALREFRPMKQSRFGGNITLLYSQIAVKSPGKHESKG